MTEGRKPAESKSDIYMPTLAASLRVADHKRAAEQLRKAVEDPAVQLAVAEAREPRKDRPLEKPAAPPVTRPGSDDERAPVATTGRWTPPQKALAACVAVFFPVILVLVLVKSDGGAQPATESSAVPVASVQSAAPPVMSSAAPVPPVPSAEPAATARPAPTGEPSSSATVAPAAPRPTGKRTSGHDDPYADAAAPTPPKTSDPVVPTAPPSPQGPKALPSGSAPAPSATSFLHKRPE